MKRGYCIGGPSHGKLMNVKHGARLFDASTGATYVWIEGQWLYEPPLKPVAGMSSSDPSVCASPARSPQFNIHKTGS